MEDASVFLTTKQKAALAQLERQEINLARIKTANDKFYCSQVADIGLTPVSPVAKAKIVIQQLGYQI